jgi:hypothetical protein
MHHNYSVFVHTLLFRCQVRRQPIPISVLRSEANLEGVDRSSFDLNCSCGRSVVIGIQAVSHWVTPWAEGISRMRFSFLEPHSAKESEVKADKKSSDAEYWN